MAESDDRVEQRSWFWAFNALRTPKPGQAPSCARCRILIAETVLFNEGEAIAWLFTTRDGEVKTKHTKRLKVETIADRVYGDDGPSPPPPPKATASAKPAKKSSSASSAPALSLDELIANSIKQKEEFYGRELTSDEKAAMAAKVKALLK